MIMSILFPDRGTISVFGQGSALKAKDRIGYLPEERGSYRKMTVGAFLTYMGCLKGRTRAQAFGRADRLLGRLGLGDVNTKKCEDLSKGMLQRVQFVASVINEPDLLILDEPFGGLDPLSVRLLKEIIAEEHQRGATIIFSTHVMAHAEELCEQIVMIHQGRKVLDEPIAGLRRRYDTRRILLEPLDPDANLLALQALPCAEAVRLNEHGCEVRLRADMDPGEAVRAIAGRVAPARIELARIRLEGRLHRPGRRVRCPRITGGPAHASAGPFQYGSRRMSINLQRIGLIAARDYKAAITSRAFLIGLLVMPVMLLMFLVLVPRILNSRSPQVIGEVAVIDLTGKVDPALRQALVPAEIVRRRAAEAEQAPLKAAAASGAAPAAGSPVALLTLIEVPSATDVDTYKRWLIQSRNATARHLALVVIEPDAVARRPGAGHLWQLCVVYLFTTGRDHGGHAAQRVRAALVATRLRMAGLDPTAMAAVQQVTQHDAVVVDSAVTAPRRAALPERCPSPAACCCSSAS